ncbi:hypothetical protein LINGRAHAP2_LOCUS23977 [Linum grandiflorum]
MAYRLDLPAGSRVRPVFHVSLLRRCNSPNPTASSAIPPVTDDGTLLLLPQAMLDTRWTRRGSRFVEEFLVEWHTLPAEDATWESASEFYARFIQIVIEDNAVSPGDGNDRVTNSTGNPQQTLHLSARTRRPNPRFEMK